MKESGFTLIELIIVILIIAILTAIALPRYASLVNDAQEDAFLAARRNMKVGYASAYAQSQKYGGFSCVNNSSDMINYWIRFDADGSLTGAAAYSISGASCSEPSVYSSDINFLSVPLKKCAVYLAAFSGVSSEDLGGTTFDFPISEELPNWSNWSIGFDASSMGGVCVYTYVPVGYSFYLYTKNGMVS